MTPDRETTSWKRKQASATQGTAHNTRDIQVDQQMNIEVVLYSAGVLEHLMNPMALESDLEP